MSADTMSPERASDKGYPEREKFFAHRLVRILTKDAVANELGPEVCWLLTVVAMQEDSKRYRGPVTYYNGQLLPLCGFSSDKVLDRARTKAVKAGFLVYVPGGRRAAGKYWCLIPDTVKDVPDGPCDETEFETGMNGESTAIETAVERPMNGGLGDHLGSVETAVLRRSTFGSKGDPSYLSPIPNPDPIPSSTPETPESLTAAQVVVTEWNAGAPKRCMRLTPARRKVIAARLRDPWWRENWRDGLARLPTARFLWGENDSGWKADFDWFIKPDSLTKILEGKYDSGSKSNRQLPLVGLNRFSGKASAGDDGPGELIGGPAKEFPFAEGDGVGSG